jgi:hypothetical protein
VKPVVTLLLVAACGTRVSAPSTLPAGKAGAELSGIAPFFVPGERMTWDMKVYGIAGGLARMAIGEVGNLDNHRAVIGVLEVETAGALALVRSHHERVTAWVDAAHGNPLRTESEVDDDGHTSQTDVHWGDGTVDLGDQRVLKVPPSTYDPISSVLLLRAWNGRPGEHARFNLLDGVTLWRSEFTVEKGDTLQGRPTIKISGQSLRLNDALEVDSTVEPRVFSYFFSDDPDRLPLKIIANTGYGPLEMDLSSYEPPDRG